MRTITAALLACTLMVSSSFAAPQSVVPLAAGKPAGVKDAALFGPSGFMILLGTAVVIGGIALSVSNSGGNGVTSPTTTSTTASGLP